MDAANKWNRNVILLFIAITALVLAVFNNCGKGFQANSVSGIVDSNGTLPYVTGVNVMRIDVGETGACNTDSYTNEPCTSVTICSPNTPNCQTINNILVDTGSYGLRVFSSVLSVPLTQENDSSGQPIAECAQFGTGSDWGPIKMAGVILGQEQQVTVPIQVIDSTYAKVPSACGSPDINPSSAGFNGILGVGFFTQDCGSTCVTTSNNGTYYTCSGSTCAGISLPLSKQVPNPIASLAVDNNGIKIEMPTVAFNGAFSTSGYLLLGIGTQANNVPAGTTTLTADDTAGEFTADLNGESMSAFIDSGSNGYFIPANSNYPDCTDSKNSGWLCPTSPFTTTGTTTGLNGSSRTFEYQIGDADVLFNYSVYALMNLGGDSASPGQSNYSDLGMPFFYGKTVFVGLEHTTSPVGTGPYWAY